jgi:hypothetical protein
MGLVEPSVQGPLPGVNGDIYLRLGLVCDFYQYSNGFWVDRSDLFGLLDPNGNAVTLPFYFIGTSVDDGVTRLIEIISFAADNCQNVVLRPGDKFLDTCTGALFVGGQSGFTGAGSLLGPTGPMGVTSGTVPPTSPGATGQIYVDCENGDIYCYVDGVSGWIPVSDNADTLQDAYDAATGPHIIVGLAGGTVDIRDASPSIGDDIFAVEDNSGATSYFNVHPTRGTYIGGNLTLGTESLSVVTDDGAIINTVSVDLPVTILNVAGGTGMNAKMTMADGTSAGQIKIIVVGTWTAGVTSSAEVKINNYLPATGGAGTQSLYFTEAAGQSVFLIWNGQQWMNSNSGANVNTSSF